MLGAMLWTLGLLAISTVVWTLTPRGVLRYLAVIHAHSVMAGVVAVAGMIAGLVVVRRAISPLDDLRARLARIRGGHERTLGGAYPSEVQPLVDDLNALLEHRDETVRRALAKAGDLAHGLKTPLALLAQDAERDRAAGHCEIADAIDEQVDRMRRQMDYHLAHARAAASGATPGLRSPVRDSAEGLARTLRRLNVDRGIVIDVAAPPAHVVRAGREDLDEMLGNLLDNACKWARTRVTIESRATPASVTILVDDDGPGLELSMREAVLRRGVRADEAAPGSGFGLAIVRDLSEVYGGSISLEASLLGGLRASLRLPAA